MADKDQQSVGCARNINESSALGILSEQVDEAGLRFCWDTLPSDKRNILRPDCKNIEDVILDAARMYLSPSFVFDGPEDFSKGSLVYILMVDSILEFMEGEVHIAGEKLKTRFSTFTQAPYDLLPGKEVMRLNFYEPKSIADLGCVAVHEFSHLYDARRNKLAIEEDTNQLLPSEKTRYGRSITHVVSEVKATLRELIYAKSLDCNKDEKDRLLAINLRRLTKELDELSVSNVQEKIWLELDIGKYLK